MRIALIGTTLFHQGAEYVLATLARGLAARGHDVTVILSKYHTDFQAAHPDWKPFPLPPEVKVIVQKRRRGRNSVFSFRSLLVQGRYDVVMSHTRNYTPAMIMANFLMPHRPIAIHVEHAGGMGTDAHGHRIEPRPSLGQCLLNHLMRYLDAQFTVSTGTADAISRMTGYPRERICTVYNPVIDSVFFEKRAYAPFHPWLVDPSIPVIVAAGAFCSLKNHSLLIRAFAHVVKQKNARLVIFGEGGLRGEYEALIQKLGIADSVSLPGFTNNLPAELKGAACFCVSSEIESFSVVLVEALASGVPVVSTNCPYGPPEILQNGKYGILVPNHDEEKLAEGLLEVLDGKGIAPPPESWKPYRTEAIVERYEEAIQEICGRIRRH